MQLLLSESFFSFSITEILLHMFNLGILIAGIYFLLYKPIKKIIDNKRKEYEETEKLKTDMVEESSKWQENYNELIKNAKKEEAKIKKDAVKVAEVEKQKIINNAKEEAVQIIEKAYKNIKFEKEKMKDEISNEIPQIAVTIATKILQREIKESDNDKIITSILEDWKE